MTSYLERLTLRLALGLEAANPAWRKRHVGWLLAQQRPDGGFPGREGPSDLYYTSFGLRGLALLGALEGEPATRAGDYLRGQLAGKVPVIDLLSLVLGATLLRAAAGVDVFAQSDQAWRTALAAALEALRRPDGGYSRSAEGQSSSVYHTFLVAVCQQLLELDLVDPARLIAFAHSRQRQDGGFVELAPMQRSGTNPTAAAVGLLSILEQLEVGLGAAATDFLAEMQTDEGGLRANTRIPVADLLSTFTGLVALADLQAENRIDRRAARGFVSSLAGESGGFHGAAWDAGLDVEYTFYGLAATALLADREAPRPTADH